jgi:phage-related protein
LSAELLAACDAADASATTARDLLLSIADDHVLATAGAASYLQAWLAIGQACELIGAPHPFVELTDVWSWNARCVADLTTAESRRSWVDARVVDLSAATAAVRARIAHGDTFPFQAHYYADGRGQLPVEIYIDGLSSGQPQLIRKRIALLNKLTRQKPYLAHPHGAPLEGRDGAGFYELRITLAVQHRIIYRPHGELFILLHALLHDQWKIPPADKAIANGRWQDFLSRLGTVPDPLGAPAP